MLNILKSELLTLYLSPPFSCSAAGLIDYASDVMGLMTRLRADWGVVYPEEA